MEISMTTREEGYTIDITEKTGGFVVLKIIPPTHKDETSSFKEVTLIKDEAKDLAKALQLTSR